MICFLPNHCCRARLNGGGVLAVDFTYFTTEGRVLRNRAKRYGGGIAILDQASVHLMRGTEIMENSADVHGGGIYSAGLVATFGK
jgi:predicted outer membrane repeat protein